MNQNIPVIAICKDTGERVGEYPSINNAARKLFIRKPSTISSHLQRGNKFNNKLTGVKSYKDGKTYYFEVKID